MTTDWKSYRNYLIFWIESKKKYSVFFSKNTEVNYIDVDNREIIIDENIEPELQLYILLHECGHILLWENGMQLSIEKKSKRLEPSSFEERTCTVIEEIEAWKRGFNLAKKLSFPIDENKWENEMLSAIGKYIKWSISPKEYNKKEKK